MRRTTLILLATVMIVVAGAIAYAQDPSSAEELAKFDQGDDTIDVSSYSAEMQQNYEIFAARCSKCHTLSRPINSDYALPDEWSRYVKRMMRKPGSGINKKDAKQIFDFLVYDSSVRKKDLIAAKQVAAGGGE